MSFDENVKISLIMTEKFHTWVKEYTKDRDCVLDQLYQVSLSYLLGPDHDRNWNKISYVNLGLYSPLFISHLKELDTKMSESECSPDWVFEEPNRDVIDFPRERIEDSISKLKKTGDVFYFYTMMLVYFGGFSVYHHTYQAIPHYKKELEDCMIQLKSYITAKKMEKEFSKEDVLKAVEYADSVDPIDPEEFPMYLLEGTGVIRKGGKYYVTDDVLKSITAAGGVAQALERQDLEGGVENAAPKQGRARKDDDGPDSPDEDDSGNTRN